MKHIQFFVVGWNIEMSDFSNESRYPSDFIWKINYPKNIRFQKHPHPKKTKNMLFPFFLPNFKKKQFPQLFPPKRWAMHLSCSFVFFSEARYVTTYRAMWDESPETRTIGPWGRWVWGIPSSGNPGSDITIPRYEMSVDVIYQVMLCQLGMPQRMDGWYIFLVHKSSNKKSLWPTENLIFLREFLATARCLWFFQ